MGVTLEQGEESSVIRLVGAIDINAAAELKKALLDALGAGQRVSVALDLATDLDVTAVQLLWAARRDAGVLGVEFALAGRLPGPVASALLQAGFEDLEAMMAAAAAGEVVRCPA